MTEKYFRWNNEIFSFRPDTHEVVRIGPHCRERRIPPVAMRALRLKAVEITRRQAEQAVSPLELAMCQPF